ncbi:MAG: DUF1959 family protein [Methanocorpusculum sp.]|nr:DUF1959 domain-containing protein [Methanocorpusculum parvum]MBQ4134934.1 DUF1959 family protein [Methanocorpusculum sp.]HJJ63797.1 hypothetical protein [Methanocorpusculum sp.]HJJ72416.1 hypothetical protein [Methanocorpusculum sp.]HJJ76617.1 hypothetical protein [Methanocorpusculum sp.]
MDLVYERDLRSMKLLILKGTRQDEAVLSLAGRLGLSRQQMRKILIAGCDMMTLENIAPRLIAADEAAEGIADELSIPHLTTALGLLSAEEGEEFISRVKSGESIESVKKAIMEVLA